MCRLHVKDTTVCWQHCERRLGTRRSTAAVTEESEIFLVSCLLANNSASVDFGTGENDINIICGGLQFSWQ